MDAIIAHVAKEYPMFPREAIVAFLAAMTTFDNDVTEWSLEDVAEEFAWWVAGTRTDPEDEGAPKAEWVAIYEATMKEQD